MELMRLFRCGLFLCFFAARVTAQQVLINEILPAPSGANFEFIELIFAGEGNIAPGDISLRDNSINWSPVRFERLITVLDTLVLVRSLTEAQDLIIAGIAVGTMSPWPTLNNGGDSLFVRLGATVQDKMGYAASTSNVSWERRAPYLPGLAPSSWMLSRSIFGASPGRTNSVFSRDVRPPRLLGAELRGDERIVAWFSEAMPSHVEIMFQGGIGADATVVWSVRPMDNRVTLELGGQKAPKWLKVDFFTDYAGNRGLSTSVSIAVSPQMGDLFFSEVHFLEGGSGQAKAAPEFFELYSAADQSISLFGAMVEFRGQQYILTHPDSLAILPPFGTFLASAKPWSSWELFRSENELWSSGVQPHPFLALHTSSSAPVLGVAPWISFKNEGESLGLWKDGALFDAVSFDQSCFDPRFDDHRGRSLSRIFYQSEDSRTSSIPMLGHENGVASDLATPCVWASTLYASGISPGAIAGRVNLLAIPTQGSLLITEVMFDLNSASDDFVYDQVEFVEFVNTSSEPINLQELWFAEFPDEVGFYDHIRLASTPVVLFPGQIAVLFQFPSSNPDNPLREHEVLAQAWPQAAQMWPQSALAGINRQAPSTFVTETAPSQQDVVFIPTRKSLGLPNVEGRFRIVRSTGEELERIEYQNDDHYKGLESTKGRSLYRPVLDVGSERHPSQFGPWTTSTNSEGASPGVVEARTSPNSESQGLHVAPLSFYPEQIGLAHEVLMHISPIENGLTFTLDVFDRQGFVAASLSRGQFLADGWTISWGGKSDKGLLYPTGVYIAVARIFDAKGREIRRFKQPFSLIR